MKPTLDKKLISQLSPNYVNEISSASVETLKSGRYMINAGLTPQFIDYAKKHCTKPSLLTWVKDYRTNHPDRLIIIILIARIDQSYMTVKTRAIKRSNMDIDTAIRNLRVSRQCIENLAEYVLTDDVCGAITSVVLNECKDRPNAHALIEGYPIVTESMAAMFSKTDILVVIAKHHGKNISFVGFTEAHLQNGKLVIQE